MNWNDLPPLFPQPAPKPGFIILTTEMRERHKHNLREGISTVQFIKADGSLREMACTLSPAHIPAKKESLNTAAAAQKSDDVCVVYDTNKQAWRSFRWDRLVRINIK